MLKRFDNSSSQMSPWAYSFSIDIAGVSLLYTYIRKNACSTFKAMFSDHSDYKVQCNGSALSLMINCHACLEPTRAERCMYRVFIYRDPFERVASVFRNKFIQMAGNGDIFKNYKDLTGAQPSRASFEDFVKKYVLRVKGEPRSIDAHLWPQRFHLMPISYNAAIHMDDLKCGMERILGAQLSGRYFTNRTNSSSSKVSAIRPSDVRSLPWCRRSAEELNSIYRETGYTPHYSELLEESLVDLLRPVYAMDIQMIDSIG